MMSFTPTIDGFQRLPEKPIYFSSLTNRGNNQFEVQFWSCTKPFKGKVQIEGDLIGTIGPFSMPGMNVAELTAIIMLADHLFSIGHVNPLIITRNDYVFDRLKQRTTKRPFTLPVNHVKARESWALLPEDIQTLCMAVGREVKRQGVVQKAYPKNDPKKMRSK